MYRTVLPTNVQPSFCTNSRPFPGWSVVSHMRKPVRLDRLRAAYQAGAFGSWHQLAKAARVSHPTLSRLVNKRIKALNPTTIIQLARTLRVPVEWLTGERKELAHVPEW